LSIDQLPDELLQYLCERYCETTSSPTSPGRCWKFAARWARVQAIVDFVHNHVTFGYDTPIT